MKEALSIQELKALCEFFFDAGGKKERQRNYSPAGIEARGELIADDFERCFDKLMQGKYNKLIEDESFKTKWVEMQDAIQNHMDKWDADQRMKISKGFQDLRDIVFD